MREANTKQHTNAYLAPAAVLLVGQRVVDAGVLGRVLHLLLIIQQWQGLARHGAGVRAHHCTGADASECVDVEQGEEDGLFHKCRQLRWGNKMVRLPLICEYIAVRLRLLKKIRLTIPYREKPNQGMITAACGTTLELCQERLPNFQET